MQCYKNFHHVHLFPWIFSVDVWSGFSNVPQLRNGQKGNVENGDIAHLNISITVNTSSPVRKLPRLSVIYSILVIDAKRIIFQILRMPWNRLIFS